MKIHDDILREILNRSGWATPGPYFVTPQTVLSHSAPKAGREKDDGYAGTLIAESVRETDRDYFALLSPETIASMVRELQAHRTKARYLRAAIADGKEGLEKALKLATDDDEEIPF